MRTRPGAAGRPEANVPPPAPPRTSHSNRCGGRGDGGSARPGGAASEAGAAPEQSSVSCSSSARISEAADEAAEYFPTSANRRKWNYETEKQKDSEVLPAVKAR